MRTLRSLSRILIHPLNKKLPVCREDAEPFLMNLRMTNGAVLRRDEQTSGVVLLIIGRKIKARQKHEGKGWIQSATAQGVENVGCLDR